jgi:uncharacterized phage-associated protein
MGTKRIGRAFGSVLNEAGAKKMYSDMAESKPKAKVRDQIDENLRRIYAETLNEQIPDKLTQLLDQLRQKSANPPCDDDREKSG